MREGRVLAVCASPKGGVPKLVQASIRVHPDGVEGDHHRGRTRYSTSKRRVVENDRTVTVVAAEDYASINAELGTSLVPGDFAENVHVEGLGPLGAVRAGDRLVLEHEAARVVLRVTGQNEPCRALLPYHPQMVRAAMNKVGGEWRNRRGLLCAVEAVDGSGVLAAGARVRLEAGTLAKENAAGAATDAPGAARDALTR